MGSNERAMKQVLMIPDDILICDFQHIHRRKFYQTVQLRRREYILFHDVEHSGTGSASGIRS